jgi:DNA invertase Pin-like site-specific DNA recombinase
MFHFYSSGMSSATLKGIGHLLGYARVSTTDQDAALQVDALNAAACYQVFVDTISGSLTAFQDKGIGFKSLQETIDTTSPGGRLVFHVFAALAEFERDLIRERTNAGLAAARARGCTGLRPPRLSPHQATAARRMYEQQDMTVEQIGQALGVSRTTIYRTLKQDQATSSKGRKPKVKPSVGSGTIIEATEIQLARQDPR